MFVKENSDRKKRKKIRTRKKRHIWSSRSATDYVFHIIHATITNFDIITIEDHAIFMISTKMFIQ